MNVISDTWRPLISSPEVPEEVRSWLAETGSLTARVRERCDGRFRLRVIGEAWYEKHWQRDIAMYCDETPLLFARTLVPCETLIAHPWLTTLGERPLGVRMFDEPGFHREGFETAKLERGDELHDFIHAHIMPLDGAIWARRARTAFFEHGFEITECFLPGLI